MIPDLLRRGVPRYGCLTREAAAWSKGEVGFKRPDRERASGSLKK